VSRGRIQSPKPNARSLPGRRWGITIITNKMACVRKAALNPGTSTTNRAELYLLMCVTVGEERLLPSTMPDNRGSERVRQWGSGGDEKQNCLARPGRWWLSLRLDRSPRPPSKMRPWAGNPAATPPYRIKRRWAQLGEYKPCGSCLVPTCPPPTSQDNSCNANRHA